MNKTPGKDASDGRATARRRTLLSGKLVYGPSEMTLDCTIADLSEAGARLRLQGPELLLEPIFLIVVQPGLAFEARQAWRRATQVGLSFVRHFDLRDPPSDLPRLVRQIWVEQIRRG